MQPSIALLTLICVTHSAQADQVQVAVTANFTAPAKLIAESFAKETGHTASLSFGSTGKFYAQIKNGAPFEVLLAADEETPARLEKEGSALSGTRFTYAIGRLALYSAKPGYIDEKGTVLNKGEFKHIAIANPKLAPYGQAAIEVLTTLKLLPAMQAKFVQAENIAQSHQFIASGNAELGFVALSQITKDGKLTEGSVWVVPAQLHQAIRQNATLLRNGMGKPAAEAWIKFLKTDKTKATIRSFGYEI